MYHYILCDCDCRIVKINFLGEVYFVQMLALNVCYLNILFEKSLKVCMKDGPSLDFIDIYLSIQNIQIASV